LLPFIVSNEQFFDFAVKHSAGGLSPRVKFKDLASYELLLPPKNVQVELLSLFQALDNELTKNKNLKEHLKQYSSAVFENIINNNYNGGTVVWGKFKKHKLNKVLSIPEKIKANSINKKKILSVRLHLKGVVKNKTVDGLKIGSTTYYFRKKGQFIYGKQNLFNGALGIVPGELDGFLSSSDIPALNIDNERILPEYLMCYFGREKFYKYLEKHSSGSGSKRISEKKLLELEIILPEMKEQQEIIKIMTKHSNAILNCEKKIRKTYALQKSLINQVF
jgi:type I restriction enzyme S subunit